MQHQLWPRLWQRLLPASLVAIGLAFAGGTALYAADEEQPAAPIGLVIVAVDEEGPAAAAGVTRGDILLTVDGNTTNSIGEFEAVWSEITAGEAITVQVQHGDEVVDYPVETGDRNGRAYLGILPYVQDHGFTMRAERHVQLLDREGVPPIAAVTNAQVVVTAVQTGSVAAEAGLQVDDVILALDGEPVARPRILRTHLASLEPGDQIVLTVLRGESEPLDIAVTLGEGANGQAQLGVKLAVVLTETAVSAEFGSVQAVPAPVTITRNVLRAARPALRFFQSALPFQDFALPGPEMMAAPDVLIYGEQIAPGSVPSIEAIPVPGYGVEAVPNLYASPTTGPDFQAVPAQPVPVEGEAAGYY